MAGKGIPELLNYKQKGKDLNEFIKVPLSESWHTVLVIRH